MANKNGREAKKRKKRTHGARANAKGGGFERAICKQLSEWWTNGARDDIFWRTGASGGRATQRAKSKRATANAAGDMCALDPCGLPFIKLVLPELKRGYTFGSERIDVLKMIDQLPGQKPCLLQRWIDKAKLEAKREGRKAILLIFQRDRSKTMVLLERKLAIGLSQAQGTGFPIACITLPGGYLLYELKSFLEHCSAKAFCKCEVD